MTLLGMLRRSQAHRRFVRRATHQEREVAPGFAVAGTSFSVVRRGVSVAPDVDREGDDRPLPTAEAVAISEATEPLADVASQRPAFPSGGESPPVEADSSASGPPAMPFSVAEVRAALQRNRAQPPAAPRASEQQDNAPSVQQPRGLARRSSLSEASHAPNRPVRPRATAPSVPPASTTAGDQSEDGPSDAAGSLAPKHDIKAGAAMSQEAGDTAHRAEVSPEQSLPSLEKAGPVTAPDSKKPTASEASVPDATAAETVQRATVVGKPDATAEPDVAADAPLTEATSSPAAERPEAPDGSASSVPPQALSGQEMAADREAGQQAEPANATGEDLDVAAPADASQPVAGSDAGLLHRVQAESTVVPEAEILESSRAEAVQPAEQAVESAQEELTVIGNGVETGPARPTAPAEPAAKSQSEDLPKAPATGLADSDQVGVEPASQSGSVDRVRRDIVAPSPEQVPADMPRATTPTASPPLVAAQSKADQDTAPALPPSQQALRATQSPEADMVRQQETGPDGVAALSEAKPAPQETTTQGVRRLPLPAQPPTAPPPGAVQDDEGSSLSAADQPAPKNLPAEAAEDGEVASVWPQQAVPLEEALFGRSGHAAPYVDTVQDRPLRREQDRATLPLTSTSAEADAPQGMAEVQGGVRYVRRSDEQQSESQESSGSAEVQQDQPAPDLDRLADQVYQRIRRRLRIDRERLGR